MNTLLLFPFWKSGIHPLEREFHKGRELACHYDHYPQCQLHGGVG
jgi:hypothetical protein